MSNKIRVKEARSSKLLKQIFEIRRKVFVEEQEVDAREEYDEFETSSTHLVAKFNSLPVGTCRFRNTEKGIKLERFAVLKEYRKDGVGEALIAKTLELVDKNQHIYLHAQVQVVGFYAKYGFVQVGEMFEEANIKHFKMVY